VPIQLPKLSALSQTAVDEMRAITETFMAEGFPNIDVKRGVVSDTVLYPLSALLAASDQIVTRLRDSLSALRIASDPNLADPGVIESIAANARITRLPGASASGNVSVIVSAAVPFSIPAGTTFTATGVVFTTVSAMAVQPTAELAGASDIVLRRVAADRYSASVPVIATVNGPSGLIKRGATMIPSIVIAGFVSASAESDFTGGVATETNAELVRRFQLGLATKSPSNRVTAEAMLRDVAGFDKLIAVSIVGFGDPEMTRDQHSIFPGSMGGRVDLYGKFATPAAVAMTKTATLVNVTEDGGIWEFTVTAGDAPGFYTVDSIAPQNSSRECTVTLLSRHFTTVGTVWAPDIVAAHEASFSPYQTAVVQFLDTHTPTAGLTIGASDAVYDVSLIAMPGIAAAQSAVGVRGARHWAGDVLVRGAVPCFLSLWCEIRRTPSSPPPTDAVITAAKYAAAAVVNRTGFAGRVGSLPIARAIVDALGGYEIGPLTVTGAILSPFDDVFRVTDAGRTGELVVPDRPDRGVTKNTVAFFLDPASISFNVVIVSEQDT